MLTNLSHRCNLPLLFLCMMLSLFAARCAESPDPVQEAKEAAKKARAKLAEFDRKDDAELLRQAYELTVVPLVAQQQGGSEVRRIINETRMAVLAAGSKARDQKYDLKDHPHIASKVSPPMWTAAGNGFIYEGMDPKDIKDPKAREQYEKDIAENEQRRAKYKRESDLQRLTDRALREVRQWIQSQPQDSQQRSDAIATVGKIVKDDDLKKTILEGFVPKDDEKKNR